jgi:acyl-CoA thioesterase FadM
LSWRPAVLYLSNLSQPSEEKIARFTFSRGWAYLAKSEGFHGETMVLQMVPTDFNRYGFDLQFRMSDRDSAREVALGKVGIVFINLADRKVTPIPTGFMAKIEAL